MTLNIYRVRVKCICELPKELRRKGQTRRSTGVPVSYADCLVEALDLDHAGKRGLEFIENSRPPNVRWLGFELMETARVHLPIELQ